MYADDSVVFFSDKDIDVIQNHLERDFSSLTKWLFENELIVNSKKGKTEVMVFGTNSRLNKLKNKSLNLQHNGISINTTNSYKYLGLTLTGSLNMTEHLSTSLKKASSRIHLLKKMRNFMDAKTARLIYQSMIIPILTNFSLALYGSTPPYIKNKIALMEDRARFIISNGDTVPITENIQKKRLCTFVHKCLYSNDVYSKFKEYYKMKRTNVNTRNNGTKIEIPKIKLEIARKSTYYQGTIVFNELPITTRKENNFQTFKRNLNLL